MVLIGGCTGNGKTLLVKQHAQGIDLEGLAHHRGSSFGRTLTPQLSQASFENHLAVELLKKDAALGAGRRGPDDWLQSPAGVPARPHG